MNSDSTNKRIKRKTMQDKIVRLIFMAITIFCASIIVFITLFILIKGITPFVKKYQIGSYLELLVLLAQIIMALAVL